MPSTEKYATPAEVRTQVEKSGTTEGWSDAAMNVIIGAVSRAIDNCCNRPDGFKALTAATARYFPGSGKGWQIIDECVEVTAVAVKDAASDDEGDYTAWTVGAVGTTTSADVFPASGDPRRPNYNALPYTMLICGANGDYSYFVAGNYFGLEGYTPSSNGSVNRVVPTVKVTAKWGYSVAIPDPIREACIVESARFVKRGTAAWADVLTSPNLGELRYQVSLDPATKFMLVMSRYVRPAIGYGGGG